jgi:hypothetical protein
MASPSPKRKRVSTKTEIKLFDLPNPESDTKVVI